MSSPRPDPALSWKDLILPVYLPSFLLAFGSGILVPTLPLYAQSFGVSFSVVSLVIAASSIGTVLADVPAGMLLERFGRKRVMMAGMASMMLSMIGVGLARTAVELIVYRTVAGIGMSFWNISRHTYVTDRITVKGRGQALAIFGGIHRIGSFSGPVAGGVLGAAFGLRVPMFVYAATAAGVLVLVGWFIVDTHTPQKHVSYAAHWQQIKHLVARHARAFATAGSAQVFAQMIRAGRQLLIPLYGASVIGLDVAAVGVILTLSSSVDMVMFPAAGFIMDRFGRKYAAVPSFLIMALGIGCIPLTGSFAGLLLATLVIGFGNGLGSGAMMTLGSDLAPREATGQFLGLWRFIGDIGSVGGPVAVGNFADLFGLPVAAVALGGIGVFASFTLLVFVKETLRKT